MLFSETESLPEPDNLSRLAGQQATRLYVFFGPVTQDP